MRVNITETVRQQRPIEITFPHYFKYDMQVDHADIVMYGRFDEKGLTTILVNRRGNEVGYEMTVEPGLQTSSCYYGPEYACDAGVWQETLCEFRAAVAELKE
jgi:hypothetical protein